MGPLMTRPHYHFVTGRLAESSLRDVLATFSEQAGFDYSVDVLKITVAALMTADWVAPRLSPPPQAERIVLPGLCRGDLQTVRDATGLPADLGPKDLRDLPEYFGEASARSEDYGAYDIDIIAEINHAPQWPLPELLAEAARMQADGADVIDLGCNPGETWRQVADVVQALRDQGHRVSIDTYNPEEISAAAAAGAELVLSVNSTNREFAADWGLEVVAVPDDPATLGGLEATIALLEQNKVPYRIDPILEPIGFGFAASLGRYLEVRNRWPEAEMMMGIGNLTELTDADSAAINVLLLGICQELGIRSVLTTQVINWARSAVKECDLARRLVHHAVCKQTLPKRLEPRLVLLRDAKLHAHGEAFLRELAQQLSDPNFRIFAENGRLHLMNGSMYLQGNDPFELFDQVLASEQIDPSHAFYLGYEMAKAVTALTLGKDYRQDQALDWGFLTVPEVSHQERKAHRQQRGDAG